MYLMCSILTPYSTSSLRLPLSHTLFLHTHTHTHTDPATKAQVEKEYPFVYAAYHAEVKFMNRYFKKTGIGKFCASNVRVAYCVMLLLPNYRPNPFPAAPSPHTPHTHTS